MVLRRPPADPPAGVTARRVESADEAEAAARIAGVAFAMPEPAIEETAALARQEFERGQRDRSTYLAFVDGVAVARATAVHLDDAALLFGGATLPEARGRGAYRALVHARWHEAAARGATALVTHAGAMSRPILERMGFEPVSRLEILVDRFA
jgi:GNAT superfamily N-acetyltransferase